MDKMLSTITTSRLVQQGEKGTGNQIPIQKMLGSTPNDNLNQIEWHVREKRMNNRHDKLTKFRANNIIHYTP